MLNLKEYLRHRILDRVSYKGPTGLVPLSGMKHATVLMDAGQPNILGFQESVRKFFGSYGIAVNFYFLDLRKVESGTPMFSLPASTLTRRQLSRYTQRPLLDRFNPAYFKKCNIFVSFAQEDSFAHRYLAAAIPADFKVGPFNHPDYRFNMVVSSSDAASMFLYVKDLLSKIS